MTAEEWQTCTHAKNLLEAMPVHGYDRQLRAFACACAHELWHLLPAESRDALTVAEAYARGEATDRDLKQASFDAEFGRDRVKQGTSYKKRKIHPQERAAFVVVAITSFDAQRSAREAITACEDLCGKQQANLFRSIVGNPFVQDAERRVAPDCRHQLKSGFQVSPVAAAGESTASPRKPNKVHCTDDRGRILDSRDTTPLQPRQG